MEFQQVTELSARVKANISRVIIGKDEIIDLMMTAMLVGGHVLLEDVPGTGKTMLAKSLAKSLDCAFKRIQFTPDLMPDDVTGMNIYNLRDQAFEFTPGPVFANVLLADEINRATPRTQSALLESMEERQVTVAGQTRALPAPFFVVATQNPIETQGTFPLPEAQLDRFFIKMRIGYPTGEEAVRLIDRFIDDDPLANLAPVATAQDLVDAQAVCRKTHVSQPVREYISALTEGTRNLEDVLLGASPRGMLSLLRASQAYALVMGRDFVTPDDVKKMLSPVFNHRIIRKNAYGGRAAQVDEILGTLCASVPVPAEETSAQRG